MARSWLLLAAAAAAVVEAVPVMRSNRAASRLPGDPFNKGDTTICHPPTQMAKTPWSPVTDTKRQLDFRAGVLAYTPDSIKSLNGSPKEYAALYLEKKPQEDVLKKLKALHEALATLVEQTQADLALVLKKSGSDFVWDPSAADSVVSTPSLSAAPLNAKDATEAHPKAVHAALKTFASAAGAWSSKASAVLAAGLKAPDFDAADKTVNLADLFWSGSAAGLKDATAALLKAIAPLPDLFEKTAKNWDEAARVIRDGLKGATKSNTVLDEAVARAAAVRADAKVLLKLGTRLCHPFGACAEPKAMASPEAALASAIEEMNGWSAYLQIRRYDMPAMKWSCEKTGMDAFSANNEGTVAEAFARNMKAIVGPAEAGKPLPFADQVAAFASRSADKEAEFQAAAKAAKGMAAGKKAFAADVAGGKNMLKLE